MGNEYHFVECCTQIIDHADNACDDHHLINSLLDAGVSGGLNRVRIFRYRRDVDYFEFAGQKSICQSDPVVAGIKDPHLPIHYHKNNNRYLHFVFSSMRRYPLNDELAVDLHGNLGCFLFRSDNFGTDPNAVRMGRDPDTPWLVIPLFTAKGCYGYISADNQVYRNNIRNISIARLLAAAWLFILSIDRNPNRYRSILRKIDEFVIPLFLPEEVSKSRRPMIGLFSINDYGEPEYLSVPDFKKGAGK